MEDTKSVLDKANQHESKGEQLNVEGGDRTAALEEYHTAMNLLMEVIRVEPTESVQEVLQQRVESLLHKSSEIRSDLNLPATEEVSDFAAKADPVSDLEEDDYIQFDMVFNIEQVECYSILNHEKQLIASGPLQILKIKDNKGETSHLEDDDITDPSSGQRVSLLKIGAYEFPLTRSIPCLNNTHGSYILPMNASENSFYGFILPRELPSAYITAFEKILGEICTLRKEKNAMDEASHSDKYDLMEAPETSTELQVARPVDYTVSALDKTAEVVGTTASYLVWGIGWGVKAITSGIEATGQYLINHTVKTETPSTPHYMVAATINGAAYVSPYAAKVSKTLVKGMANAASNIGSTVINTIPSGAGGQGIFNGPKTEAAKRAGQVAFMGFSNIWDALDGAGRDLVLATSTTTAKIVDHKLGPEHAKLTEKTFSVALDSLQTVGNVRSLGLKRLARKVAKETGKGAIVTYVKKRSGSYGAVEMQDMKAITNG
ncbi:spartin-like protein [Planoprotostelium fungivorum]|uniref:Spartin-like protein n=1 Tax=Planoprotostelium fungivorum TaxID=1890364 RepID=A0A2P6N078_9EUKA|nr:spartin-like protein [Planoprotostelium fungivorum]